MRRDDFLVDPLFVAFATRGPLFPFRVRRPHIAHQHYAYRRFLRTERTRQIHRTLESVRDGEHCWPNRIFAPSRRPEVKKYPLGTCDECMKRPIRLEKHFPLPWRRDVLRLLCATCHKFWHAGRPLLYPRYAARCANPNPKTPDSRNEPDPHDADL